MMNSEKAVSPVIGVILMVAITVLLATVVGVFVLGSSPSDDRMPQATLEADEKPEKTPHGQLTVKIRGAEAIETSQLKVVGDVDATIENNDARLQAGDEIVINVTSKANPGQEIVLRWFSEDDSRIFFEHRLSENWT
jgi:flagellin-like protein